MQDINQFKHILKTLLKMDYFEILSIEEKNEIVKKVTGMVVNYNTKFSHLQLECCDYITSIWTGFQTIEEKYDPNCEDSTLVGFTITVARFKILDLIKKYNRVRDKALLEAMSSKRDDFFFSQMSIHSKNIESIMADYSIQISNIEKVKFLIMDIITNYLNSLNNWKMKSMFELEWDGYVNYDISRILEISLRTLMRYKSKIKKDLRRLLKDIND